MERHMTATTLGALREATRLSAAKLSTCGGEGVLGGPVAVSKHRPVLRQGLGGARTRLLMMSPAVCGMPGTVSSCVP
jgi:hypothetical protein